MRKSKGQLAARSRAFGLPDKVTEPDDRASFKGFDPYLAFPLDPVLRYKIPSWEINPDGIDKRDPRYWIVNGDHTGGIAPSIRKDRGTVVKSSGVTFTPSFPTRTGVAFTDEDVARLGLTIDKLREAVVIATFLDGPDPDAATVDAATDAARDLQALRKRADKKHARKVARYNGTR
jgi:hypothetical protein